MFKVQGFKGSIIIVITKYINKNHNIKSLNLIIIIINCVVTCER